MNAHTVTEWVKAHKIITGIGALVLIAIMTPNQPKQQEQAATNPTPKQPSADEIATKHFNDLGARMASNSDGLMQDWRKLGSVWADSNLVAGATQLCNGEHVADEIVKSIGKHVDCKIVGTDEFQRKASYNRK